MFQVQNKNNVTMCVLRGASPDDHCPRFAHKSGCSRSDFSCRQFSYLTFYVDDYEDALATVPLNLSGVVRLWCVPKAPAQVAILQ